MGQRRAPVQTINLKSLRPEDGRAIDALRLNVVEPDRRRPPPNYLIEQLAQIIGISAVLFFQADREPAEMEGDPEEEEIEAANRALRKALKDTTSCKRKG